MSHRKFEAPRRGAMAFLPRKRCRRHRGRIRSFPPDDKKVDPHLTAFIGYKAGMTHIMRELDRPGSKAHKKDIVEGVTIIETPPIVIVGLVGYVKTPGGLRSISTVWAGNLDDSFRRRFYKNWARSKKKAFTKYMQQYSNSKAGENPKEFTRRIKYIKKYADVVRVVAHSQVKLLKNLNLKKAHIMEIQVNGGSIEQKVDWGVSKFEKPFPIKQVFNENDMVDTIAVTKGHGFKGVVNRWGVTRLPRKTHRGNRKVACIGAWHPARVQYTIARAGQKGYHHRTETHKKIYRIGDAITYGEDRKPQIFTASTETDLTQKTITPLGGFVKYGVIKQDFIMIKGTCPGPRKRPITLRKPIIPVSNTAAKEEIQLKFIDTSSQMGNGRFQTKKEKVDYFGPLKKDKVKQSRQKRAAAKTAAATETNTKAAKKEKAKAAKQAANKAASKPNKANKANKTDKPSAAVKAKANKKASASSGGASGAASGAAKKGGGKKGGK